MVKIKEGSAKECILIAFVNLLTKKPYNKITISDIIRKAGVARATFYRNFSTIDEVLKTLGQLISQLLSENVFNLLDINDEEKTFDVLVNFLKNIKNMKLSFSYILRENIPLIIEQLNESDAFKDIFYIKQFDDIENKYQKIMKIGVLDIMLRMFLADRCKEDVEVMAKITLQGLKALSY